MARSRINWTYHKGQYRCPYCNKLVNIDYAKKVRDKLITGYRLICPGCWRSAKMYEEVRE